MREQPLMTIVHSWLTKRTPDPRILSFGCSIGDELASLRTVFPSAEIHGCDVHPHALEVAERTVGSLAHVFHSDETEIRRRGPFDLVCAFSSLCMHPAPPDLAQKFSFARFEEVVELFAEVLAPGGVLALFNTNYLFAHTQTAKRFDILRPDSVHRNGWVDVVTPQGDPILRGKATQASYAQTIESREGVADDWELIDCLFVRRSDDEPDPPRVIPLVFYDPRTDLSLTEFASWTRSDLDTLPLDQRAGYLDLRRTYRLFTGGGSVWLEQEVWRDSLLSDEPILTGVLGRTAVGEGPA